MSIDQYLVPWGATANICFDCQLACGRCSWSGRDPTTWELLFEPVPGWTAKKSRKSHNDTYHITACPLFIPDEPRETEADNFV